MSTKSASLIKKLREEKELSQLEVAEKLGISRTSYISFEKGDRDLSLDEASILGSMFDISLEEINIGKLQSEPTIILESNHKVRGSTSSHMSHDKSQERISIPQEKVKKYKQVLLYILSKVGGKPNIGQTVLYKILYFIDFDYYEKYEEQLIGARYIKNTHGPTPVAFSTIISSLEKEGKIETIKSKFYKYEQTKYLVNPNERIEFSELSAQELAHIDEELGRLSDFTASQISALSHKDTPWLVAKEKEQLDYEYVFYRPEETSVRAYEQL
ncbi:MAG: DUF4065 domain-containing protein [Candidatus Pacebacteria bacterium]|nr:DUF4065 domain-containing protein [Candidatus Paceibacterota bacterium]MBP9818560.1 DUF4065 domain-containing protein [Candidatus Paceibacterota bacterium]